MTTTDIDTPDLASATDAALGKLWEYWQNILDSAAEDTVYGAVKLEAAREQLALIEGEMWARKP